MTRPHCPRAADCRAQGESGYYCPCKVRGLLGEYAELLEQRAVLLDVRGGSNERVQGKRPAYQVLEDQLAQRADIVTSLTWLCAEYPSTGYATATAYGLKVEGTAVEYIGDRDGAGRMRTPPIKTIAVLLSNRANYLRDRARQAASAPIRRDAVREMIQQGVEAMAYRLGWRPGYDDEGAIS